MTCQDLDRLLHPYVDGELDTTEGLLIEEHLTGCAACARRIHGEKAFRSALRAKLREATDASASRAPDALRRNVLASLQKEHRARNARQWTPVAAAAAVLLVAGSMTWNFWPKKRERYLEDGVKRHARALPAEIHAQAHDEVEAWFGGKLDHRVPVPRFPNAEVAGARLSNVHERPAAYIRYQKPDARGTPRTIGLFVFGDHEHEVEAQPLPSAQFETRLGYNVALWRDGEIVYEMVTDLDEGDIRALLQAQQRGGRSPSLASPPLNLPQVRPVSLDRGR